MTLRVLVVARWYPAHDDPGRGIFVSDLVEALVREGVEITVASFESVTLRRTRAGSVGALEMAASLWRPFVTGAGVLNTPVTWGAGTPVARLPAFHVADETVISSVAGHAALLVPFGVALHRRWPIDLVHAHTGLPDGRAALELASQLGRPLIVTEHDSSLRRRLRASPEARAVYRSLLRGSGAVLAVSEHLRELLGTSLRIPDGTIDVLPNPISPVFFAAPLQAERDARELLYVGARRESKGVAVLLDAFARARAERPELRLRLIGRSDSPTEEEGWRAMTQGLGIADRVSFEAPTDRAGVAAAMARAAALVHPSPFETFGMVAAEALACGLPVAATRSGVEGIVGEDGTRGEIASGTDAAGLARAILRLLERRGQYDPEQLRAYARERFEAGMVARSVIDRYRDLLRGQPPAPAPGPEGSASHPSRAIAAAERPLVIGLNRAVAERRIGQLPRDLAREVTLLTDAPAAGAVAAPPVGHLIEVELAAEYRAALEASGDDATAHWSPLARTWRFLRSPRMALRRRRIRRRREALLAVAARRAVVETWRALRDEEGKPRRLMPLEADDVLAAGTAIEEGAELTPGSTRWLADRWDEDQAESQSAAR